MNFFIFFSFHFLSCTFDHARELASRATIITIPWASLNYLREKSRLLGHMLSPLWYNPTMRGLGTWSGEFPGDTFRILWGWNVLGSRDLLTYHTWRHHRWVGEWVESKAKPSPGPSHYYYYYTFRPALGTVLIARAWAAAPGPFNIAEW